MSKQDQPRTGTLKNQATRERWDLFHRAIEHAKNANDRSLLEEKDAAVLQRSALGAAGS